MSTWLTEKEYRQSGAIAAGMTINAAFMDEIKTDFDFRSTLNRSYYWINQKPDASPRLVVQWLCELRDQLETYFALEEFYGYFHQESIENPIVNRKAREKTLEHGTLYLDLSRVIDLAEQIVYGESADNVNIETVRSEFEKFCIALAQHEQDEMELIMQLCNQDIGVGD
jgi:hypothetical protein